LVRGPSIPCDANVAQKGLSTNGHPRPVSESVCCKLTVCPEGCGKNNKLDATNAAWEMHGDRCKLGAYLASSEGS
jgi:hypothetical protein